MTQSTFPPAGVQPPYGQQGYGQQGYGQQGYGAPGAAYGPPGGGYGYQQPPKKKTGLIVGSIIGAVILIGGLVVGAIFLFGSKTLDSADAQKQVTDIAQQQLGVTLEGVSCPTDVEVQAGSSFTCTATVDGQDVSFTVTQKDDQGNVEITSDNTYVQVSDVEDQVSQQVQDQTDIAVSTTCDAGGHTVLIDPAGTTLDCTVTNNEDSTDTLDVTATIAEDGTVSIEG